MKEKDELMDELIQLRKRIVELEQNDRLFKEIEKKLQTANQQLQASEQQLTAANQQINASNQQLQASEQQLKASNKQLSERIKEMKCLYGISKIIEIPGISLEEIFRRTLELIPASWQYPEITVCRIILDDKEYKSPGFRKTKWSLCSDININDNHYVNIEIYYLEKKPDFDEGPFLKEERLLLDMIAERLGKIVKHEQVEEQADEALRESEEKYRVIAENAKHIIFTHDLNGKITYANTFALEFLNVTKDQIIGQSIAQFIYSNEYMDAMKQKQHDFLAGRNIVHHYEKNVKLSLGEERILEVFGNPIKQNDKINSVLIVAYDITERKKAEEERKAVNVQLQKTVQKLQLTNQQLTESNKDSFLKAKMLDQAPMIISQHDLDHRIVWANKAYLDSTGLSMDELKGKKCWEVWSLSKPCVNCPVLSTLKDEKPHEYLLTPENQEHWPESQGAWLTKSSPIKDEAGKIAGVIETAVNVTERLKAEQKIKESEEKYSILIETTSEGFWLLDSKKKTIDVNQSLCDMLGYSRDEMIGKTPMEFADEENKKIFEEQLSKIESTIHRSYEILLRKKDRTNIPVLINATTLLSADGKPYGSFAFVADYTERKLYQTELIEAKERAEESDRLKSAFLANMSHEIRTPMNGILGFTSLLLEPKLNDETKEAYIKIINQSGERMLNTVTDIIEISKIEAGIVEIKNSLINLNESVESIINFFQPQSQKKGLSLTFENKIPESTITINTDKNKFDSILTNLIKNAIKYTNEGRIIVSNYIVERTVEFCINDTGIGIPKNRLAAIFNRFEQADIEDANVFQGSGLGLAIAKSYIEMQGGNIWVESIEGKGSQFYFNLPIALEEKENTISAKRSKVPNKFQQLDKINILIVEDDEISIFFLERVLENIARKIVVVTTGKQAIEECSTKVDYDLILMDIKMVGISGYEATKQIRKFNKDIVIIAQTAFGLAGDREKSIAAGCNDYISKPIQKDELLALIHKHFTK